MFLVACNEAFGYSHEQTLSSSFTLILAMLREHGYLINQRNKVLQSDGDSSEEDGEWIEITDFETGKKKRIQKVNSI